MNRKSLYWFSKESQREIYIIAKNGFLKVMLQIYIVKYSNAIIFDSKFELIHLRHEYKRLFSNFLLISYYFSIYLVSCIINNTGTRL